MSAHLVVGGGDHSAAVTNRLQAALAPHRPVVRPWTDDRSVDPVVAAIETHLDRVLAALDLPAPVVSDVIASVLPPQLPSLLRLARVLEQGAREGHELVIDVDIEVARLLDLPQRVARALAAFVPVVARWQILVAPEGIGHLPQPDPPVLAALREGAELLESLDRALADPEHTTLHLAVPAGPVGAARRADAEVLLALMGRTLTAVHPGVGTGVEHLPSPMSPCGPRVERCGGAWLLHLDVPGVRAVDLDLVRHEDEVVLSCAGRSRRLRLPSVLRRCDIDRAGVAGGVLTLTLTPDEAVWPRG